MSETTTVKMNHEDEEGVLERGLAGHGHYEEDHIEMKGGW